MTNPRKTGTLAHVAINADDVAVARRFYEAAFGWCFAPWGPPGFFHITTAEGDEPGVIAALQQRRELLPGGERTTGAEPTIAVDDVDAVLRAVAANGGTVLMEPTTIAGVGELVFFADPSGNVCGAMRYDDTAE